MPVTIPARPQSEFLHLRQWPEVERPLHRRRRRRRGLLRQGARLVTGRWSTTANRPGRNQKAIVPKQRGNAHSAGPLATRSPYDPFKDPEKARKREGWPPFEAPTQAEIETIAMLRGLSAEGVAIAVERGLLFCADTEEGRTWVITDSRRLNAQARRMDGAIWEHIGGHKAWTLPGSIGALPIGLYESRDLPKHRPCRRRTGSSRRIPSRLVCNLHAGNPGARKGLDVAGKLGVVAMPGTPSRRESYATSKASMSASSRRTKRPKGFSPRDIATRSRLFHP